MVNDIVCLPLAMSGDKLQCVLRRISTILCIYCLILSEDAEADSLQKLLQYATGAIVEPFVGLSGGKHLCLLLGFAHCAGLR